MNYKVIEINTKEQWVKIIVTFDDDTTYTKRMMVDVLTEDGVNGAVQQWLSDYLSEKKKEAVISSTLNDILNVKVTVKAKDLPKPTKDQILSAELAQNPV